MISRKTKYGLRSILHLAKEYDKGSMLIVDLAKSEKIPKKFLEAILLELKNHGVLHSKKGKRGGYTLAKPPHEITMGEVVRILEGPLAPVSCVSVSAYRPCDECEEEATCGIKIVMRDVRDAVANILDHTTLQDVITKTNQALQEKSVNYFI